MTAQLGTAGLVLGVVASALACAGWVGAARGHGAATARWSTYGLLGAAVLSTTALQWALLSHDFSVRYVADNGGRDVPLYYTVTSMWGALEGSLVLWLLVLGVVAVVAMRRPPAAAHLHAPAMAVIAAVALFFFALALGGGNAFERVSPVPADGPGPNPLLQDHPAMGAHPPLLYAGYIGLTVPFAYAVAALVRGEVGPAWVRAVRGWTLASWALLTAGIFLGAWWSYAVLGWGGYWAWDPVENAALLPWLTATALVHSLLVQERRRTLRMWNLSLAVASFALVVTGTFLTRSGVLDSVHAFTTSALGPMLLGFLALVLLGWTGLVVWRMDRIAAGDEGTGGSLLSRQTAVLGNNLLLTVLTLTVLLGTVFPAIAGATTGDEVSVGPPYYSRMVAPIAFLLLALMAIGPLLSWDGSDLRRLRRRATVPLALAAAAVGVTGLVADTGLQVLIALGLGAFVVATLAGEVVVRAARVQRTTGARRRLRSLAAHRRPVGVLLAHSGVVLAAVAVTVSAAHSTSQQATLATGEAVRVGDVTATLDDVERAQEGDRMTARASMTVRRPGAAPRTLVPELTFYPAHSLVVATPAIATTASRDLYLTVVRVDPDAGTATVRLAENPLIGVLWASGGVLLTGSALAAPWPRRRSRARDAGAPAALAGDAVVAADRRAGP